jgi:hypothetical protein
MCINVKVFDAIAAHGRGVTLEQARELLPAIAAASVVSAVHRLSVAGSLKMSRTGKTIVYNVKVGESPTDRRGRPRSIAAAPRSATSG